MLEAGESLQGPADGVAVELSGKEDPLAQTNHQFLAVQKLGAASGVDLMDVETDRIRSEVDNPQAP
jgi:hypothetical protein